MASNRENGALAAVRAMLDDLGLEHPDEEVLRSENNVVIAMSPSIVVKAVESEKADALHKEARILHALGNYDEVVNLAAGVPMIDGRDGWTAAFLQRLNVTGTASVREAHQSLRRLHHAMASLDFDLVTWTQQLERTAQAWKDRPFTEHQQDIAERAYEQFVSRAFEYDGPVQVLHGDAWTGQ